MCINDEGRAGGGLWQACFFFNNLLQHDWNTSRISAFVLLVSSNYYFNLHSPQRCYNMSAKINRLVHCLQIFKLDFFQISNLFSVFDVLTLLMLWFNVLWNTSCINNKDNHISTISSSDFVCTKDYLWTNEISLIILIKLMLTIFPVCSFRWYIS